MVAPSVNSTDKLVFIQFLLWSCHDIQFQYTYNSHLNPRNAVLKMSFSSKVVIVTGGSSGIGASTAISFAKEGADVAIVGRNENRLKQIAEKISRIGKKPFIITADVNKDEDLKAIIAKTIDNYGKIDVLVNSAGIIASVTVLDEKLPETFDKIMNTNLRSVVLLTNYAAPHLVKTKGNIVNVSSVAGTTTMSLFGTGYAASCASKAGLDHFSRVAALELADKGVRVNIVSPGPVETPIIEWSGTTDWNPIVAKTALKVLTQPEEIADMVLYLASDKARSITGSNFVVDSGISLKM